MTLFVEAPDFFFSRPLKPKLQLYTTEIISLQLEISPAQYQQWLLTSQQA